MNAQAWVAIVIGFLTLEISIVAAWMSLRDRVMRTEVHLGHLSANFQHVVEEADVMRETLSKHYTRLELLEQRLSKIS